MITTLLGGLRIKSDQIKSHHKILVFGERKKPEYLAEIIVVRMTIALYF